MYFSPFAPPSPTAPKAPAIPSQNLPQNLPHTSPNLLKPSPKMTSPTHFFGGENYESDLLFCGGSDSWIFLGKNRAKTWSKRAQSGYQGRLERVLGCLGRGEGLGGVLEAFSAVLKHLGGVLSHIILQSSATIDDLFVSCHV